MKPRIGLLAGATTSGILCAFLFLTASSSAYADVIIFNDFAPGSGYESWQGAPIRGADDQIFGYRTFAEPFTSSIGANVTQIDIGLTTVVGYSGYEGRSEEVIVTLAINDGGLLGKTLKSWDLTNLDLPRFGETSNSVTTISDINGVHLSAGDSYYLSVTPANSMAADVWNTNVLGITNTRLWNGVPQPDALSSAFRIWGTPTPHIDPVPLPGTLPLFATGLGVLGLLGWRRKRKAQAA